MTEHAELIEQFPEIDDHVGYVLDTALLMCRAYAQAVESASRDRSLGIKPFEEFDERFSQLESAVKSLVTRLKESPVDVTPDPTIPQA